MKNANQRQRLRELRRTHNLIDVEVEIQYAANERSLESSNGPDPVFRCVPHSDGSLIALAGRGQFWYISKSENNISGLVSSNVHTDYARGLIRVHDDLAISVGYDGRLIATFFKYPSEWFARQLPVQLISLAAISSSEFVLGDGTGVLRFFEHRNGFGMRQTHSITSVHQKYVDWIAVHGRLMVTVSACRTVSVFDTSTKKRVAMLPHRFPAVYSAINEHLIATAGYEEVRVFANSPGYRLLDVFKGLNNGLDLYCVDVIGDSLILTAGFFPLITVTSLVTKRPITRILTSLPYIQELTLTPDGRLIAVCDKRIPEDNVTTSNDPIMDSLTRLAIITVPRKHGVKRELMKEAVRRFGIKRDKPMWKLRAAVMCLIAAVTLCVRKRGQSD